MRSTRFRTTFPPTARAALALGLLGLVVCGGCARAKPKIDMRRQAEGALLLQEALKPEVAEPAAAGPPPSAGAAQTSPSAAPRLRGEGFWIECRTDRSAYLVADDGTRLRLVSGERQRAWESLYRLGASGRGGAEVPGAEVPGADVVGAGGVGAGGVGADVIGAGVEAALLDPLLVSAAVSNLPLALAGELRRPGPLPGGDTLPNLARRLLTAGAVDVRGEGAFEDLSTRMELTPEHRRRLAEALAESHEQRARPEGLFSRPDCNP